MARTTEDRLAELLWQLGAEAEGNRVMLARIEAKLDAVLDRHERRIEELTTEIRELRSNGATAE